MNRKKILDYPIDMLSMKEFLSLSFDYMEQNKFCHIVTINPEIIMAGLKNKELEKILKNADIIIPEASGIKLAFKFKGTNIEQVTGIEFSENLIKLASENGKKVAFVGAKKETLEKMSKIIQEKYPMLNIVYKTDGYFEDEAVVIEQLEEACPDIVFVALGSPKQDYFIKNSKNILNNSIMIGIGGSFDVWAGNVNRAPVFFRKFGLEWFYRLITQPSRFNRMFPTLPLFLLKSIMSK